MPYKMEKTNRQSRAHDEKCFAEKLKHNKFFRSSSMLRPITDGDVLTLLGCGVLLRRPSRIRLVIATLVEEAREYALAPGSLSRSASASRQVLRAAAAATLVGAVALPMIRRRLRARGVRRRSSRARPCSVAAAVLWPRVRSRAAIICACRCTRTSTRAELQRRRGGARGARALRLPDPRRPADRILVSCRASACSGRCTPTATSTPTRRRSSGALGVWFATPHASLAYLYFQDRPRFARAAVLTYAVFDTGVIAYWLAPTAPPWYAAQQGRLSGSETSVRRLMVEYGERFWGRRWGALYSVFGGNPLAAMPSLHLRPRQWRRCCSARATCRRAPSAGPTPACWGSRLCTSGSTTPSTCSAGSRSRWRCGGRSASRAGR